MSAARPADPYDTLPLPSRSRLTNSCSALSAQSALTLSPSQLQASTRRRSESSELPTLAGVRQCMTGARAGQSAAAYVARPSASGRRDAVFRQTQPMRAERAWLPWGPGPGSAGRLAIGGSKGGARAAGEASVLSGPGQPHPSRFRPRPAGGTGAGPRARGGRAGLGQSTPSFWVCFFFKDTDTPQFLAALF